MSQNWLYIVFRNKPVLLFFFFITTFYKFDQYLAILDSFQKKPFATCPELISKCPISIVLQKLAEFEHLHFFYVPNSYQRRLDISFEIPALLVLVFLFLDFLFLRE
jgi:hypothetical protein